MCFNSETCKLAFFSLKKASSLRRGYSPCQTVWSNRECISGTKFVFSDDRMVNAQSYLSKPKSYENSITNIFIEKTKPGNRGTPGRRDCQLLGTIWCYSFVNIHFFWKKTTWVNAECRDASKNTLRTVGGLCIAHK